MHHSRSNTQRPARLLDKRGPALIVDRMPRSATLQDVADHAGVHRTTVSLALRDQPRIPLETRRRIAAIARKLGYRTNPLVAALMQSRRTGKPAKHTVLAYVTCHPTRFGWRPPECQQPDFFPGAVQRAQDFGYKLEHFWLTEPDMSPARFCQILDSRGIHGMIIGRLPVGLHRLQLTWERFSCVALGLTLESPQLHHVAENHHFTTRHSMQQCLARGYRRIGFVFSTPNDYPRVGDRWLGGYLSQQLRLDPADRIPPYQEGPEDRAAFLAWFKRWQPDALLASRIAPVIAWLRAAGYDVPRDVGLVELRNENPADGHAGVFYDPAKLGALGVEMLLGLMHRCEIGPPADPHEIILSGKWIDGPTLPAAKILPRPRSTGRRGQR